jgi:tripartite-type tricarboxylate transporter receptor subunit TctC
MTVMPAISPTMPYSPTKDFLAVSMAGSFPLILVVNSAKPITSVKDLIEYGKKRPDEANYAGSGTMIQLASELFNLRSGSRFVHVPYKGSGDSINALLSGQVTMAMMDAAPATGPLKSGKLRGLAVTSAERLPAWPELPTMAEAGLSDMVITPWVGFFAPVGTPQPVVKRLQEEVRRVVQLPDVRSRLESLGITPVGAGTEEFTRIVASDLERFTGIAKAANIKAE